jgi:hypothetical protein
VQEAGTRAGTPPSYLSALRQLESPVNEDVLNLAATLTTQAEDDASEAGLRYLRAENYEDWRAERSRDRLRLLERGQRDDIDHRDRLRRVMNRLSRIHDPPATGYSDRVPSQNNLYDWSPANEADDEDELDQILAELRREQPNTHPEILRVLGRSQLDTEREARMRTYSSRLLNSNQPSQSADSSLRSAAILQSVRRHPRFSARTRDYIQRYNSSDRDVASRSTPHHSESTRDRYDTSSVRQAAMQRLSERRASLERERDRDRDMLNRVDSFRRSYLDRDRLSNPPLTVSPMLEQTIKYLARIRYSANVDDSLNHAIDAGFLSKDYFCDEQTDFVLDTFTLPPPVETSWLAPGAVLSGCQHATTVTSTVTPAAATSGASNTLYRFRNGDSMSSTLFDPGRPWLSHNFTPPHRRSTLSAGPETVTSHSPQQDRWPVKVTIHAVDYARMTVSATMEAYNVPSHPHSLQSLISATLDTSTSPFTRTSSITTYLEGEILDFNQHTFLTESFKSNAGNDAMYWRKLPCFQKYTDEELVRNLTSRRFFNDVLCNEWVLMRWKERCFVKSLSRSNTTTPSQSNSVQPPDRPMVTDSFQTTSSVENHYSRSMDVDTGDMEGQATAFEDSSCGLTISGFYYVCLRRSDGKLEGLYYDPQSSPYQCLKLESVNGGVFPAWEFR